MNVLGLSAFNHDSAACILINGKIISAVEEERFSRIKHDPRFPLKSVLWCLENAKLSIADIDCIAFYECEDKKLSRQLWSGLHAPEVIPYLNQYGDRIKDVLEHQLGYHGELRYFSHHHSHAAASYFLSGFQNSAILVNDGVGEWETSSYWQVDASGFKKLSEIEYPHSIGLFYATITGFLGFNVNNDEYKVMGLSSYGNPTFVASLTKLIYQTNPDKFELDLSYFDFFSGKRMHSDKLSELLGMPERRPQDPLTQRHFDLAKSAQVLLQDIIIKQVRFLKDVSGSENLCLSGGVALNCVANSAIRKSNIFKDIFIPPAAGDSGCALGAAFLASYDEINNQPKLKRVDTCFWGPKVPSARVLSTLEKVGMTYRTDTYQNIDELIAEDLSKGKIVGFFRGSGEFGPRALGARSILADPRHDDARDKVNTVVKHREKFRPFAPLVIDQYKKDYFNFEFTSTFMTEVCEVKSNAGLPAITHVDNTARIQTISHSVDSNPVLPVLNAFHTKTGCPVLLNTSFNLRGEPVVNTVEDAIRTFVFSEMDVLAIENYVIYRSDIPNVLRNANKPKFCEHDESRTTVYSFF